jgi:hypothetical protein
MASLEFHSIRLYEVVSKNFSQIYRHVWATDMPNFENAAASRKTERLKQ